MFARLQRSPTLLPGVFVAALGAVAALWIPQLETQVVVALSALAGLLGGVVAMSGASGSGPSLAALRDAVRNAARGDRPQRPVDVSGELADVYDALDAVATELRRTNEAAGDTRREVESLRAELATQRERARTLFFEAGSAEQTVSAQLVELGAGVDEQQGAAEQTTRTMTDVAAAHRQMAQHVEALAASAEQSTTSIAAMTAANDAVSENMAYLAASVRETVGSIEEMSYSIKEVARNVDELSLTAEETNASMNAMNVSIDQVQTNANETARLSEEVTTDAERGAEAILKTIAEINRIKDSANDAGSVIAALGGRIEAIGDILDVIDDVAEQTNLLALNAAIIAAQAGEHGKGFAVVADEIKDLAERAGSSTREIADLIKTIQAESKNAIAAVERGTLTVDRGVVVSADAERALKKILESSQKSTNMVRAIARATVEQARGSKQVTDSIGRIAETVQQIATATSEQARGSELIMKGAEKMRQITQQVERSAQEQARGGRQITAAMENISGMVQQLHGVQRAQSRGGEQTLEAVQRIQGVTRANARHLRALAGAAERLQKLLGTQPPGTS
jgi:methyl-accepting chemotaxis protein